MALEALSHPYCSYVTLTYSPDGLYRNPSGICDLSKRDVQLYLKRLRKAVHPIKFRYFACGEYGSIGQRPHYHLIIYGLSPHSHRHVKALVDCWSDHAMDAPLGHVTVMECNHLALEYVAGYVTKKIVTKKDVHGRQPEFTLQSRRPGIGYSAVLELAKILDKPDGKKWFQVMDNGLPGSIRINGRSLPLGRFLSNKLKDLLWIEKTRTDDNFLTDMAVKFFHSADKYDDENAVFGRLAMALMAEDEQKEKSMRSRFKIFNNRKKL